MRRLEGLQDRARLLLRALRLFYGSLGAFAATALISIVGSALVAWDQPAPFEMAAVLGLATGSVGVGGLVVGCILMVHKTRLAVRNLTEEATVARSRSRAH